MCDFLDYFSSGLFTVLPMHFHWHILPDCILVLKATFTRFRTWYTLHSPSACIFETSCLCDISLYLQLTGQMCPLSDPIYKLSKKPWVWGTWHLPGRDTSLVLSLTFIMLWAVLFPESDSIILSAGPYNSVIFFPTHEKKISFL